ncbi:MAG: hypothetical protein AAGI27_14025 [Pseudomonadota bacterium]
MAWLALQISTTLPYQSVHSDERQFETSELKARAPLTLIGPTVKDWVLFFESDYEHSVESSRNIHTGEPAVLLILSKGQTEARFFIDLVTGSQFLLSVESTSEEFLERMKISSNDLEQGDRFFCEEEGYDCVKIEGTDQFRSRAKWSFYFD